MSDVAGIITRAIATCGGRPTSKSTSLSPDQGTCQRNSIAWRPGGKVPRSCAPPPTVVDALVAHRRLGVERGEPVGELHAHVVRLPGRAAEVVDGQRLLDLDAVVAHLAGDRGLRHDERLLDVARHRVDVQDHVHRLGLRSWNGVAAKAPPW